MQVLISCLDLRPKSRLSKLSNHSQVFPAHWSSSGGTEQDVIKSKDLKLFCTLGDFAAHFGQGDDQVRKLALEISMANLMGPLGHA